MIVDRLEDTLNGGYKGLYNEIAVFDVYRIRNCPFQPDIIFDVGANVGIFCRYARTIFPNAKIVALEPHPENVAHLKKFTTDPNLVVVEKALATTKGNVYRILGAVNGAGESYQGDCLGYPEDEIKGVPTFQPSGIPAVSLDKLIGHYWRPGMVSLIKIDCEGAENCIWSHKPSMIALRRMDFITAELHFFALNGRFVDAVRYNCEAALRSFEDSHICFRENLNFWAIKNQ